MRIPRRTFFGLAPTIVAGCAAPGAAVPTAVSMAPAAGKWAALRSDFILSKDKVQLGNLLIASNPKPVRDAVERHRKSLDENPVEVLEHELSKGELLGATLDSAARYMGVQKTDIALTDSTTSGIAVVYGGLALERGDEIVTTKHDHFVTHESLRLTAERTGATVKAVALYEDGRDAKAETMARAIENGISAATRVVAITWVHSSTGVKTPVRAIAEVVAKANASRGAKEKILLCVDGVHGFGVENAAIPELGCDVFIAGCHKWIFGPRGTGLVWAKSDVWEKIRPQACPFDWQYIVAREHGKGPVPKPSGANRSPGGFRAYEHRWALKEAFDYHLSIGKPDIESRIHALAAQCKAGLSAMKHVKMHTPVDQKISSSIVTCEIAGLSVDDAAKKLLGMGIVATTTPYDPSYLRFTPGITNTPEEIDRALDAVRKLA